MSFKGLPKKQGLYDPAFEKDSCGVGFICQIKGKKSHKIVLDAIEILNNLTHRGACGCDPHTGDGAGILIQIPDTFLRNAVSKNKINLPKEGEYGVGIVFLPTNIQEKNLCEEWIEHIIHDEGQRFLGWRKVPCDNTKIGYVARSVEPEIKQIFIGKNPKIKDPLEFERKLYLIRKQIEKKIRDSKLTQSHYFYICSLSSRTLVYKGQLMGDQVSLYYPDLANEDMISALAMVHSRYSTNTFPTWALAHPYRMLAHNGEINTLRGNINWMRAREKSFASKVFGEDLKKTIPVLTQGASDSAIFDNALEILVLSGRSLPHAVMMMIPEAWSGHISMDEDKKAFYEYHSCLMEPWDGPASIAFTDGRYIGAVLDRNGLRPSRYLLTDDDHVIMASETGVLSIPPEKVILKWRLQPGKMFLIDTKEGRIIDDKEIKTNYATSKPYKEWVKNIKNLESLPEPVSVKGLDTSTLLARQITFGYTLEDLKILLDPMYTDGEEATGSMGTDTPLAVLSNKPQLLFNYFKQLFAQVTNPPVDAIREEIIMANEIMLGPEQNILDETELHCRRLKISHPILNNVELEKIKELNDGHLKAFTLKTLFKIIDGEKGLEKSLELLFEQANKAIQDGYNLIILSDRGVDKNHAPIPSLLACAALHHNLIRLGTRNKTSLILETGEAREMHHFAVLIGYGANAINPYLTFETIENEIIQHHSSKEIDVKTAIKNYIKATKKGLYKVISKMGISTIQSYCGAQIFEAVGLGNDLVEKYFTATPSRIGGIGIDVIAKEMLMRHEAAYPKYDEPAMMDVGGEYHWRRDGQLHQFNPQTIALLQHAARSNDYNVFKKYSALINDQSKNLATIRGLLKFKKNTSIPIEEVEPVAEIVKRFATGAMSYGSISKEAHETLAIAMNRLGGFSNTGEGGEDADRFKKDPNGDWRRSRIKQVAQGRFGVTIEYLVNADQLQIKMAQGAKPGEGGQLPGHKVSKEIAGTRYTTPGVGLISPPPHHDIYSIEDLAQLIHDLKNSNRNADVSVKLVAEVGVGTVAAGVSKGKSDHVLISGYDGGTGASPQTSIKHAGLPWELGLAETQQTLVLNDLRGRIRVQTDGQLKTGRDVTIACLLGADEFGFSTSALIATGCILLRKCHLNTCSVGIATQDPELRKQFTGKPEHVVNFFTFIAQEVREIMAELGFRTMAEMTGRVDMLETDEAVTHWKTSGLDFTDILHRPDVPEHVAIRHVEKQNHGLEKALDNQLLELCKESISSAKKIKIDNFPIQNINRTVGTILSSEIAKKWELKGLPNDTIEIHFTGSAGQSFGAFLAHGVTFYLEGDSNDYLAKGISGGKIIVYPSKQAKFIPEQNIIVGNVLLYGAISGEVYIRGIAGERFAVRNSGAHAVVEGTGDHGCEYMTGGRVVVLGPTGRNFAAGMSGGITYVWDPNQNFKSLCNTGMVELFPVSEIEDISELKQLIENHYKYTMSTVAQKLLNNWNTSLSQFIKVYPIDYKRVIEEAKKASQSKEKELVHG